MMAGEREWEPIGREIYTRSKGYTASKLTAPRYLYIQYVERSTCFNFISLMIGLCVVQCLV